LLAGSDLLVNGIRAGYISGDVVITPNMWNGSANLGEFGLTGTYILANPGSPPSNSAPILTSPGNQVGVVSNTVDLQLVASDPDFDPITYAATGLPPTLTVGTTTGGITGTLTTVGTYNVSLSASDSRGGINTKQITWTVTASGGAVLSVGPVGRGITGKDDATGAGYAMYTAERIQTRFTTPAIDPKSADHILAVRFFNGNWEYVTDDTFVTFVPRATDILLAELDFSADTVNMLIGINSVTNGIKTGYVSSDIVITPNMWNGAVNAGEFGLAGTTIVLY
jgi:hypothetical protein